MQDFRKLSVWTKAHELTLQLYRATDAVSERRYPGLVSQIRRSASSIPANIAEGCGRGGQRELAHFLTIALASAFELDYHLQLASDLGVLSKISYARLDARTEEVRRMLSGLVRRVRIDVERVGKRLKSPRPRAMATDD